MDTDRDIAMEGQKGQVSGQNRCPVNVVTGFLGSGKTTVIMKLLEQLPNPEKVVWLKNEYGDENIDKLLLQKSNVKVSEIMNGCLCCVLVGRLGNALQEIQEKFKPERIIIETSGTAYPAPIVWEIKKYPDLRLDSVINVIDAINFSGYEDKSYSARLQSKYNDIIVINKYPELEAGSKEEMELEQRLDDVYELNPSRPKIKTKDGFVSAALLLGVERSTELDEYQREAEAEGEAESEPEAEHEHDAEHEHGDHQHADEVETFALKLPATRKLIARAELDSFLAEAVSAGFIRIKGAIHTENGAGVYNWILGRADWQSLSDYNSENVMVFMGKGILDKESSFRDQFQNLFHK